MSSELTYMEAQKYLEQLKLNQAQLALDRLADEASKGQLSYLELLGKLLAEEITARQERADSYLSRGWPISPG